MIDLGSAVEVLVLSLCPVLVSGASLEPMYSYGTDRATDLRALSGRRAPVVPDLVISDSLASEGAPTSPRPQGG